MTLIKIIAFFAAVTDFVFCGLLSNGFITAVLITEWVKSRSLPACEQLLLSLGISNICVTFASFPALLILSENATFSSFFFVSHFLYSGLILSFGFLRYWLTAWLCVFYCIKILNITNSFFLWWKMRISRLVPRLIVGSCIISFFSSFSLALSFSGLLQNNGAANNTNTTIEILEEISKVFTSFFFVLGSGCPVFMVFLCSLLVVASLYRHVSRITSKGSNFRSPQTEAHVKAARTVLLLLFLYISYYVAQVVILLKPHLKQASIHVASSIVVIYSPVQGAILVLSNPKVKQTASWMLARLKFQPSMVQT